MKIQSVSRRVKISQIQNEMNLQWLKGATAMTQTKEQQIARRLRFREETDNSEEHHNIDRSPPADVRKLNQHFVPYTWKHRGRGLKPLVAWDGCSEPLKSPQ